MTGDVFVYGVIGTQRGETSAENVRAQLELPENKAATEIILHIMSGGGDVDEGEGIYNALKNSGKKIITHIEGTCASIATLIAAAGNKVIMNTTGRFMIHNPQFNELPGPLDAKTLRRLALRLDQVKTLLVGVYDQKTSLGKEKLWELYDNETWLTAAQAEQMGFIDESTDAIIKAVAKVDLKKFKMENKFDTLAKAFKNFLGLAKIKNEFTETLQDGTIIIVMSEDEDWTGKQVVYEDGSPLPDGDHVLASGKTISVGAGVISGVKEAAAADKQDEEMENRIKELEAQLAESNAAREKAEAAVKVSETKATTAEAKATRIFNQAEKLQKDYSKLAEEAGKTIGDTQDPPKGPVIKNVKGEDDKGSDPMGEEALQFFRNRNIVK